MKKILLFLFLSLFTLNTCLSQDGEKTLLIFGSKWCKFCTKMKNDMNNYEPVSEALKKYSVIELDYDKDRETANGHRVNVLPTIIIFQNGKEIARKVGHSNSKDLAKFLE